MLQFEKISLKQIFTLLEILSNSTLFDIEFLESRYSKNAQNFEETVEFLRKINLISKVKYKILPKAKLKPILNKPEKFNKQEELVKKILIENLILQKNPFSKYLMKFLSQFHLKNRRFEFSPSTSQRLEYSGLRNFLISLGFIYLDLNKRKYIVSDDSFLVFSELRESQQLSLNEFLKISKKKEQIAKAAELEIIKYEKNRLSHYPHLIEKIEHISVKDVTAGYDIKSFNGKTEKDDNPSPRYIEVKAVSSELYRFFWTRNEIEKAKLYRKNYYLYLVPVLSMEIFDLENIMIIKDPYMNLYKNKDKWIKKIELIEFSQK